MRVLLGDLVESDPGGTAQRLREQQEKKPGDTGHVVNAVALDESADVSPSLVVLDEGHRGVLGRMRDRDAVGMPVPY
ncbi:hypothetical protein [Streptomyces sp. NBC_01530]|uniref:hypothetical protein n=1 Tax=Streptomyces sp. NBC_01530 TaxID=2903895 RepID=UPI003868FDC5